MIKDQCHKMCPSPTARRSPPQRNHPTRYVAPVKQDVQVVENVYAKKRNVGAASFAIQGKIVLITFTMHSCNGGFKSFK